GQRHRKPWTARETLAQQPSTQALSDLSGHPLLEHLAADVDQASIAHPGGARGFATAAGKTAVEVQLSFVADRIALEHLLDEIDTAARSVKLVAQQLIGRTRR